MNLRINEGITKAQIKELIYYSNNDALIREFTTDNIRFKDSKAFSEWLKKKRTIYALTDESEKLLGIVWFGQERIPDFGKNKNFNSRDFGITFGIRLYDKARGKGLSKSFFDDTLALFKKSPAWKQIKSNKIWLTTYKNNSAAISLYKKLGFVEIAEVSEEKLLMAEA